MIRYLLTLLVIFIYVEQVTAQYIPNTNQSFQLAPVFNPAFTGIEEYTSIKIGNRTQWSSFPGAPRYINFVVNGRVRKPANVTHNALKQGTALTVEEMPRSKRMIHGLGASLVYQTNGSAGIIENMEGGITYSVHYPIGKKTYLAVGVSSNYNNMRIRWDKLQLKDPDKLVDGSMGSGLTNINVRTGMVLYGPRFYFHMAYLKAYSQTQNEALTSVGYRYQATGGAGLRFNLSPTAEIRPSVNVLVDEQSNIQIDYAAKFYLGNRAWGGFQYRDIGFAGMILGFEINPLLGVSYSYEIATNGMQSFNNGSNEIIVGLKLANLRKVNPYLW
jgi:type IX secretion system PorP/SprF family membrane protein